MFSGYRCNGPNNFEFLGIFISRNEDGDVILSMKKYIESILKSHNVIGYSNIPASKDLFEPYY